MTNLTQQDLQRELECFEQQFRRLSGLYATLQEAGLHEDGRTQLVYMQMQQLEVAGFMTLQMSRAPELQIDAASLAPFHAAVAQAESLLESEWAKALLSEKEQRVAN
jgi:hypothetical protein